MRRALVLALSSVLSCAACAAPASAQQAAATEFGVPSRWLQGYTRSVSGEVIGYPWAYPGQAHALLTRAVDGTRRIEWEGEAAPPGPSDEPLVYLWHGGLASGYGAHRFTLSVNGAACASFTSGRDAGDRAWSREGEAGCVLAFQTTRVGTFNELFGLMRLSVPRRLVGSGPPRFSVVGEAAGSQDYYMTFEERVEPWIRARAEQARFADGRRAVRLEISRIGASAPLAARLESKELFRGRVNPGYNLVTLSVDETAPSLPLVVEVDGQVAATLSVALPRVRAWEIHLLPHSHVDIGYSDPQPVVEQKQWKNLRDAVALAADTAGNPPESRFKWNVEGLWSVESYLKQASPEERGRFVQAVRDGTIGLQANYTNILTGLCTPEELDRWTDAARRLAIEHHLPVGRTAMHTDIPGLAWTVVAPLAHAGVRYFSSGPNYMPSLPDGGDRIGETLHALGDQPFWWVSPSGRERLLFWMAGRGYSLFHGLNTGAIETAGRQTLLDYLLELDGKAYPYEMVQVRYTVGGDNGPTDAKLPAFVKGWNETFASPRLVIDTADAMFEAFERRYGATLPERRGDMTPYWEDGAVSSAAEEAMARRAARRLQQAEALWTLQKPASFPGAAFSDAWRAVLLWHEHTWGAADSISQPDRPDVVAQWTYKRAFALESEQRSRELLQGASPTPGPAFQVVNTHSWTRDGLVMLDAAATAGRDRVTDGAGAVLPSQRLADGRLAVRVSRVPAFGAVRLRANRAAAGLPARRVKATTSSLDNGRLRVEIDPATGNIRSLRSAALPGVELAPPGARLGGYLYVAGRDPAAAAGPGPATARLVAPGPLLATIEVTSAAPGVSRLVRRISLAADSDALDVEIALDKTLVRDKESAHVAFPVNLPDAATRADLGEAVVRVGADQIAGSCRDFIGVTSAIDISNARAGLSIVSFDAPLFELGGLTDERLVDGRPRAWRKDPAGSAAVFAYLLNNYWHTNYKADQPGPVTFRFRLRPHGPFDALTLRRAGADSEQPLLALPAAADAPLPHLPFRIEAARVIVSSLRPTDDGTAVLVRIYNPTTSAEKAWVVATGAGQRAAASRVTVTAADADGRAGAAIGDTVMVPAQGTVTVRVDTR